MAGPPPSLVLPFVCRLGHRERDASAGMELEAEGIELFDPHAGPDSALCEPSRIPGHAQLIAETPSHDRTNGAGSAPGGGQRESRSDCRSTALARGRICRQPAAGPLAIRGCWISVGSVANSLVNSLALIGGQRKDGIMRELNAHLSDEKLLLFADEEIRGR